MKPLRGAVWVGAFVLLALDVAPAHGGWCNVFQVTCWWRRRATTSVNYYAPAPVYAAAAAPNPCCTPCPPTCTTRYVQRCYYQPVVSYQARIYYEPVTTYRTSYYYEPVTSYRYSCYYDPCTCSYQQVAVPTTSYRVRSQCCPVESWVQRCCQVPVTTYQQSCYWEPVTTCCTTTTGAPVTSLPPGAAVTPAPPSNGAPLPRTDETRTEPLPGPPPGTIPNTEETRDPGPTAFSPRMADDDPSWLAALLSDPEVIAAGLRALDADQRAKQTGEMRSYYGDLLSRAVIHTQASLVASRAAFAGGAAAANASPE